MTMQAKRHRIISRESGELLSVDEFLTFDEAEAIHEDLVARGVAHSWESTDDGKAGWCGVARTFGREVTTHP